MVKQFLVQWTPKRIKTTIIHKLGGYTYKDLNKDFENIYIMGINEGQRRAFILLRDKISSLYGLPKQEWIDKVWYMITHARFINRTKKHNI